MGGNSSSSAGPPPPTGCEWIQPPDNVPDGHTQRELALAWANYWACRYKKGTNQHQVCRSYMDGGWKKQVCQTNNMNFASDCWYTNGNSSHGNWTNFSVNAPPCHTTSPQQEDTDLQWLHDHGCTQGSGPNACAVKCAGSYYNGLNLNAKNSLHPAYICDSCPCNNDETV